jgi:hypothetical protein
MIIAAPQLGQCQSEILTGNRGRFRGGTTGRLIQQLTAKGYAGSAEAIGKKSEVTDAHERFG